VEGVALDRLVQHADPPPLRALQQGSSGPVVISAGHGWYFDEASARWSLQRDYYGGIVEDMVNWDIARYLLEELWATHVDARPARHADRGADTGPSGHPRWQESAKYFIRAQGAPADVSDFGASEYARDINSRPFYSNWLGAVALISIHNNGGGGTGTETWFDETNGLAAESQRLAQLVNDHVVSAIRREYDPHWPDRGLRSCNGCKGETRLASRPAVLLEVGFMDMPRPDNAALQDDTFKRIVARAVREALQAWARGT
jgi:N-acetylmuramoyl-L-alanine amidase